MAGPRNTKTQPSPPEPPPWHAVDAAEVFARLEADHKGLASAEAARRLAAFGPNAIPHAPPPAWWHILLRQFKSPIIFILGLGAAASLAIGHVTDAAFIGAVLVTNALIGGFQEHRAETSTRALQRLLRTRASVLREGEIREIDAESVVAGDIVWLEPGNRVPADARLLATHGFEVDESLLTGESLPVNKEHAWIGSPQAALADRRNMALAGSTVVRGRAEGIVVAIGSATHVGRLALDVLGAPPGQPPLLLRLARFTRVVGAAVLVASLIIAVLGMVVQHHSAQEMFLFAVALAVSAIPEGLPIAITVALAVAATRMARRRVIVRRLGAVEGLGSCTLIASDKTGTLTCNELTVRRIRSPEGADLEVTGEGFAPAGEILQEGRPAAGDWLRALARAAVLCNEADLHQRDGGWHWRGDPTDVALLSMAHKTGLVREEALDRFPQVNQIPFEPEHRFAASFHRADGAVRVFVKGAPERVLPMCETKDAGSQLRLHEDAADLAAAGFRVLAVAEGPGPEGLDAAAVPPEPAGLVFLGFVGMIDPLRPGAAAAIETCRRAGIAVTMVTGDHPATALAIARQLGLADEPRQVVTGDLLAGRTEQDLQGLVAHTRVFARVAPGQKLHIVKAAQLDGHFVAVTGDGANDAPALRTANVGVAMGLGGTDVAREAADLVVTDDNFATIVAGVEEGRVAYDNIRKVIYMLLSTGGAEVVLVALAISAGMPLPLLPVQLLWLNLVTNGIQDVALACEPNEGDVLHRPPRDPTEPVFNRVMIENTVFGALLMGVSAFAAFWWMLRAGWSEPAARNAVLLLMVLFENVHIGNCRSETKPALVLSPFRSPLLLAGAVTAFLIHVVSMYLPIGRTVLETEPVGIGTWAALGGIAVLAFALIEAYKMLRWRGERLPLRTEALEKASDAEWRNP